MGISMIYACNIICMLLCRFCHWFLNTLAKNNLCRCRFRQNIKQDQASIKRPIIYPCWLALEGKHLTLNTTTPFVPFKECSGWFSWKSFPNINFLVPWFAVIGHSDGKWGKFVWYCNIPQVSTLSVLVHPKMWSIMICVSKYHWSAFRSESYIKALHILSCPLLHRVFIINWPFTFPYIHLYIISFGGWNPHGEVQFLVNLLAIKLNKHGIESWTVQSPSCNDLSLLFAWC